MKRFWDAVLVAGVGFLFFHATLAPAYAASDGARSQAAQSPSGTTPDKQGADSYANHCAICHGEQREGILPAFPPLLGIKRQLTDQQITDLVHKGKGRMPAFPKLQDDELTALLRYLGSPSLSAPEMASGPSANSSGAHSYGVAEAGGALFHQNCAFCHGRDTMGGETGPDLTRSKLVQADVAGDKISEVVRNGRPEKKMPAFNFSSQEVAGLAAYIHS